MEEPKILKIPEWWLVIKQKLREDKESMEDRKNGNVETISE